MVRTTDCAICRTSTASYTGRDCIDRIQTESHDRHPARRPCTLHTGRGPVTLKQLAALLRQLFYRLRGQRSDLAQLLRRQRDLRRVLHLLQAQIGLPQRIAHRQAAVMGQDQGVIVPDGLADALRHLRRARRRILGGGDAAQGDNHLGDHAAGQRHAGNAEGRRQRRMGMDHSMHVRPLAIDLQVHRNLRRGPLPRPR